MTAVLAIPLADELPTPNARKTYALAIWLLQAQRLPICVLESGADRIVFALRRAIEGELGKEGKKGSASDGLKAIHDLSVIQPAVFVPKFEALLPSVLANLLAPTLVIRTQACHALGGFARGLSTLPSSSLHTRVSAITITHLLTASPSTPRKSPMKQASPETTSALSRTIRTTLQATEVQQVAQGPVWGLSVLAALIVLANSAIYTNDRARKNFKSFLNLGLKHQKSTIRALTSAVWRVAMWAYCQPVLPTDGDGESEIDGDGENPEPATDIESSRESFWKDTISTVVEMGTGVSTIAALLEDTDSTADDMFERITTIFRAMTGKGGESLEAAIDTLERMVCFEPAPSHWRWNRMLPRGLFSASPGLLTADFNALEGPVRAVNGQCPDLDDVRPLSREEIIDPVVFDAVIRLWKECIECISLRDSDGCPEKILSIWENVIQPNVLALQDGDEDELTEFANRAVSIIVDDLLFDSNIDVTLKPSRSIANVPDGKNELSNATLKLKIGRELWNCLRKFITHDQLVSAGGSMIMCLMQGEDEFTDSSVASRRIWATFCADVLVLCSSEDLEAFWNYRKWKWAPSVRQLVWTCLVKRWMDEGSAAFDLEVTGTLISMPFMPEKTWDFENQDCQLWEVYLGLVLSQALDQGLDTNDVLEQLSRSIIKEHIPISTTASRIADILLSHLKLDAAIQVPDTLFEFVNDTLRSSYPPEPRNKLQSLWTLRSVGKAIDQCDVEHLVALLGVLAEGLSVWLVDEHRALSDDEYGYDLVTLYENLLVKIAELPSELSTLKSVESILVAVFMRPEGTPAPMRNAFAEFWSANYAQMAAPKNGWPTEIQTCLDNFTQPAIEPWSQLKLSPAFESASSGPKIAVTSAFTKVPAGSPFKLRVARFRSVSVEPDDEDGLPVTVPSTPVTSRSQPCTPSRPHKQTSSPCPSTPESPIFAYQPPSTPSTPKRVTDAGSPSKRRKLDNKENESPRVLVASVMDRIAAVIGKPVSPSKKRARASDELEDERAVELSLIQLSGSPAASKKQKRLSFDGVEVSKMQDVYGEIVARETAPVSRTLKRRRDDLFSDAPKPSSSDDDAFFGQVTPHHVISPALRTKLRHDDPPSSDDSSVFSSPVKSMISRRLQRSVSAGKLT
ncbi:unnamed protein product [Mycena citricolor]|uniref:Telomere-associated protein Rif1 N-terminal domain-containing protein n=1 Tax=Mycena citricolor TaxID=2018698 RepID=A0AAD2Q7F1_9AGAR|nr:unnamed protein product [Mycena citricolor]